MSDRVQRVAAYVVCLDDTSRLLLCRLTAITSQPGAWTLPGGGIDFGEHPEAGAQREVFEETGYEAHITGLLAVDSVRRMHRDDEGKPRDYHSIRIIYRAEIVGGALTHELDGSTDLAQWFARDALAGVGLVDVGALGTRLAWDR